MTRKADNREQRLPVPAGELPDFVPVPRQTDRHDGWTEDRQRRFIAALADTGSVHAACKAVNMSQAGAYYLRRQRGAESFRAAWQAAIDLGVQRIEDVAMDRALNGVDVPVYSYGKLVGTRTTYNDRLLMFMLRNRAPDRFTEGRAKGLNAVGQMELKRLKKQWREEYERERAQGGEARVFEELETKLQTLHQRHLDSMSPRARAAWDAFKTIEAEDKAAGYRWWDDPEHPLYDEGEDEEDGDDWEERALPEPGWKRRALNEEEPEENPKSLTRNYLA
ncbi:hypothetical protein ABC955_13960 [Citromicrobium bathyomarinum]